MRSAVAPEQSVAPGVQTRVVQTPPEQVVPEGQVIGV